MGPQTQVPVIRWGGASRLQQRSGLAPTRVATRFHVGPWPTPRPASAWATSCMMVSSALLRFDSMAKSVRESVILFVGGCMIREEMSGYHMMAQTVLLTDKLPDADTCATLPDAGWAK